MGYAPGIACARGERQWDYQVAAQGESYLAVAGLFVRPEHRRRGLGGALLERLLAAARERGLERHVLASGQRDWPALLRFYARHGFRPWFFTMFTGPSTEEQGHARLPFSAAGSSVNRSPKSRRRRARRRRP